MPQRYALYFTPEHGSPLAVFGARWLGRDAGSGATCVQSSVPGVDDETLSSVTRAPRRYGFHATLKPPFALAEGRTLEALLQAVARYVASRTPVTIPPLELTTLGSFLALVPSAPAEDLDLLAEECVTLFDGFRAPPSGDELMRRRAAGLTPRQETLLSLFGYPYVLQEYRFHLSLTGPLGDEVLRERMSRHLRRATGTLCRGPLLMREICVFQQQDTTLPFTILKRFPLAGQGGKPLCAKAI